MTNPQSRTEEQMIRTSIRIRMTDPHVVRETCRVLGLTSTGPMRLHAMIGPDIMFVHLGKDLSLAIDLQGGDFIGASDDVRDTCDRFRQQYGVTAVTLQAVAKGDRVTLDNLKDGAVAVTIVPAYASFVQVKETGRTSCEQPNHANVSRAQEDQTELDVVESCIQELVKPTQSFHPVVNNCINVLIGAYRSSRAIINTHNLCHDLHGKVGVKEFASGCVQEQRKLFGCAPHMDRVAELETAMRTLRGYLGSNRNIPTGVMDVINKQLELAITPEERQPPAPAAQQ